jgi:endonuclease/exonuclease/phosphatase family metal-dependent hydrolase
MVLKFLTYNMHYGVGRDKNYRIERIIKVIENEDPDVVALQEVDYNMARTHFDNQSRIIGNALGMHYHHCVNRHIGEGRFGITALSKFPFHDVKRFDLSYRFTFREPRGALRADIIIENSRRLHFFNIHLGLSARERYYQMRRLLSGSILLDQTISAPVVALGDFNDRPIPVVHTRLQNHFIDSFKSAGRTRKSTFFLGPIGFRLDYIYFDKSLRPITAYVVRNRLACMASDHFPVVALAELN